MANLIDTYNALVPTMNKLAKEGYDLWPFHDGWSGFGFKVIMDKTWIEVRIYESDEISAYLYKRNGNVFDSISNKLLKSENTSDTKDVYTIIKRLVA